MVTDAEIDAVTNSVMMAMTKELDKHRVTNNHRHHPGNRLIVRGMIAAMMNDPRETDVGAGS